MNSFFKQLLGSLVQIGINELGRKTRYQGSDIRDQCLRKNDPKNQAREVNGTLDKEQGKFWAR